MSISHHSIEKITELKQRLTLQAETAYAKAKEQELEAVRQLQQEQQELERCRQFMCNTSGQIMSISDLRQWSQYVTVKEQNIKNKEEKVNQLKTQTKKKLELLKASHMEERKWEKYQEKRKREQLLEARHLEQVTMDEMALTGYLSRTLKEVP